MSQLPQNNETLDNSPEYSEPYQENSNGYPGNVAPGGQLPPASEFSEDVLSQETGRFAANLSLLFGALSFACIPGIRSWSGSAVVLSTAGCARIMPSIPVRG